MKIILTIVGALLICLSAQAQNFSYIYIQGDKEIPFYVQYNNEMMPRYGKNYSVISKLAPGPITLKILFEQNSFTPVVFNILVPDGGERSFMLTKKENSFVLYDLQQQIILQANNNIDDDKLPPQKQVVNISDELAVEEENRKPGPKHGNPRYKDLAPGEQRQNPYKAPKQEAKTTKNTKDIASSSQKKERSRKPSKSAKPTPQITKDATENVVVKAPSKVKVIEEPDAKIIPAKTPSDDKPAYPPKSKNEAKSKVRVNEPNDSESKAETIALPTDKRPVFIPKKQSNVKVTYDEQPQFLEDIVLPNNREQVANQSIPPAALPPDIPQPEKQQSLTEAPQYNDVAALPTAANQDNTSIKAATTNSDCEGALSEEENNQHILFLRRKDDDEHRLNYMQEHLAKCYTTAQLMGVLQTFTGDAGKYSLLKKIYPRVIDKQAMASLASTFANESYKQAYLDMLLTQ